MFFSKKIVFATFFLVILCSSISAQRSPYAGSRPSGYKDRLQGNGQNTVAETDVGNRFGEQSTERLPYDAHGDAFAVQHGQQLPEANRPFWLLNQAHIETQRGTPQNGNTVNLVTQRPPLTAANETAFGNNNNNNNGNNGIVTRFGGTNAQVNPNGNGNVVNQLNPNIYGPTDDDIVYPSNVSPEQRQQMEELVRQQFTQGKNKNANPNQLIPNNQQPKLTDQQLLEIQQQQRQFPQRPQFQQSFPQGIQQQFQPVNAPSRQTRQYPEFFPRFAQPDPYYGDGNNFFF